MKYCFKSKIKKEDSDFKILIPFNVWEIYNNQGALKVDVSIAAASYTCELEPLGNGHYYIPVPSNIIKDFSDVDSYSVSFKILDKVNHLSSTSPYSVEHPIRKIDNIKLVTQPNDGLCGQTCIAMLANVSLDEACEIMRCRDWQASMGKMVDTLDYLGIAHANIIYYTQGVEVTLPKCAILMEKMGRYSHYLIYFDGTYYDPTTGILESFDMENLVGYLEIDVI